MNGLSRRELIQMGRHACGWSHDGWIGFRDLPLQCRALLQNRRYPRRSIGFAPCG